MMPTMNNKTRSNVELLRRVNAKRREDQNAAVEQRLRNGEQAHPQAHQRQVEHQQHNVADIKTGNQAPDQRGGAREQQWPRLEIILFKGRKQNGGRCRGWKSQCQQWNQHARNGRVIGRFRAGNTFDGAAAKFLWMLGELFFKEIGQEGRNFRAARRQRAEWKPECGAAQPWFP